MSSRDIPCRAELLLAREETGRRARLADEARRGTVVRVRPGVYLDAIAWKDMAPHERYRTRVAAAALVLPGAVFARESAAVLLGLPVFGEPRHIHLYNRDRRSTRRFGDVVEHASLTERPIIRVGDGWATDAVATTIDTARHLPLPYAVAMLDAAAKSAAPLADLDERRRGDANRRGTRALAWAMDLVDPRAESVGESVSRTVIHLAGFADPDLQVEFRSGRTVDRTDFFWPGIRVIGEFDGYEKYGREDGALAVRRVMDEKRREDRLRRRCAEFIRWDWAAAHRVSPLVTLLRDAGVPQVRTPAAAILRSFAV